MRQIVFLILSFLILDFASAQVSVIRSEFNGRQAYSLQNSHIRITMLTGGGYIAELSLISSGAQESVNPLFVPHYNTIDPHSYNPESHQDLYGIGRNAKLMAGYMGHYLCFPYFGGSLSSAEEEQGYSTHGEAFHMEYKVEETMEQEATVISATAELPLTKYAITRSISLLPAQSVIKVEEEVENLEDIDRPFHWVQHVTFGKPFIEYGKTMVDAPVSRIAFSPDKDDPSNQNSVQWPQVTTKSGESFNSGIFNSDKGEGLYRAWLMDAEREYTWFIMYNTDLNLLVGYVFSKDENPWIGDWQENQRSQVKPRNGKTVAWGLEVGTTPFGSGISSIEQEPVFDTTTFRWIGAQEKTKQSYLIFLLEIDEGFRGIDQLELEKGAIVLVEKESGRQIKVANGFQGPGG